MADPAWVQSTIASVDVCMESWSLEAHTWGSPPPNYNIQKQQQKFEARNQKQIKEGKLGKSAIVDSFPFARMTV